MTDSADNVNTETTIASNVRPLQQKKEAKKPKPETDNSEDEEYCKPKAADLYESIFHAIKFSLPKILPYPNFIIEVVDIGEGGEIYVEISKDGICTPIKIKHVHRLIQRYVRCSLAAKEYRFTASQVADCAAYWDMTTTPIENPPHVRFESEEGLCWNRIPFKLAAGPTPCFDEMFARMTNREAVKAWIGSLFVPESYNQQYVWLHGKGNDGKSSLFRFLAKCFGRHGALAQSQAPDGPHWAEPYPNKRLVYFPDFKDFKALERGPLKQLTGDDTINVNPKGRPAFDHQFQGKLIFGSQGLPVNTDDYAILRRTIFAEMTSKTAKHDAKYLDKLWAEGGAFLHACIQLYHALCPDHGPIPIPEESFEVLEAATGSSDDDQYQYWFDVYLEHRRGAELSPRDLARLSQHLPLKLKEGCHQWLRSKGIVKSRVSKTDIKTKVLTRVWVYGNVSERSIPQYKPN